MITYGAAKLGSVNGATGRGSSLGMGGSGTAGFGYWSWTALLSTANKTKRANLMIGIFIINLIAGKINNF